MAIKTFLYCLFFSLGCLSCSSGQDATNIPSSLQKMITEQHISTDSNSQKIDTAIFAAGCFWCVEGQFKHLNGVLSVKSGYIGGSIPNPSYEQVCKGTTGHAEAVRVVYDPNKIAYEQLLAAFFVSHDPTQLNRQGNDIGTQYRSAIFPTSTDQNEKAKYYIKQLNEEQAYPNPIVTKVEPIAPFYEAESYHDNYFELNPQNAYCQMVVKPKIEKFKKVFAQQLKKKD